MNRAHEGLEETLKALGYRLTPQRSLILAAVQARDDHFSTEEVYAEVLKQYRHANISTVYRTLELLANLGLVTSTDLGDGRLRYHRTPSGHHHHLICQGCGHIRELDESVLQPLADKLLSDYSFRANLEHLAIFGRCMSCQKSGATPSQAKGPRSG